MNQLICESCSKLISVYYCPVSNKKICNLCCDDYQLARNPIEKCLSCIHLPRDMTYKLKNKYALIYSHHYANKYIMDNTIEGLFLKAIELYKRIGVDKIEDRYQLALQYQNAKMNDNALLELNHILEMVKYDQDKALLYESYGDVYLAMQQFEKSKDAYIKSISYGNDTSKVNRRLGETYSNFKDYSQAIFHYKKALEKHLDYELIEYGLPDENYDSLYFTNYYSLASSYLSIKDYKNAIINAEKLIKYYGGYNNIIERYFSKISIQGDNFIPSLIPSIYEIMAISFKEINEYSKSKQNIGIARIFDPNDVEMSKLEGYLEGKLESYDKDGFEENLNIKLEMINDMLINLGSESSREIIMGDQYVLNNNGNISNLSIGHNALINIDSTVQTEIKSLLNEIKKNLCDQDIDQQIDNIVSDIDEKRFQGLKTNLNNLLIGVASGLIANSMPILVSSLSQVISNL